VCEVYVLLEFRDPDADDVPVVLEDVVCLRSTRHDLQPVVPETETIRPPAFPVNPTTLVHELTEAEHRVLFHAKPPSEFTNYRCEAPSTIVVTARNAPKRKRMIISLLRRLSASRTAKYDESVPSLDEENF
jgi:hypothetical protein